MEFVIPGAVAVAGAAFSARWNWWRPAVNGVPVLMYHKVGNPPADSKLKSLWVQPDKFRRQMAYLARGGFHAVTFKDLYNAWDKNVPLPQKPVLITFDDGYANNYEQALPILRDFGFRATLFVVVEMVGRQNDWHDAKTEGRIDMVTWQQLKDLQRAGWEIGSHTLHHPRLPKLSRAAIDEELRTSRQVIGERLEEVPQTFAYPYGAGEDVPEIREQVAQAGYRIAVGIHSGKWDLVRFKSSPFNLPRVFVRGDDTMLDFHLEMTRGRSRF